MASLLKYIFRAQRLEATRPIKLFEKWGKETVAVPKYCRISRVSRCVNLKMIFLLLHRLAAANIEFRDGPFRS